MLKNTLVKGLTTLNSQLFTKNSFKNYLQFISSKSIFSNNTNAYNLNIFLTGKRFFSTQEANNNSNTDSNTTKHESGNKTDLVVKQKNKKKKNLKAKTEEGKNNEKAEAQAEVEIDTEGKPTAESQTEGEAKADAEKGKNAKEKEKEKVSNLNKEEQMQLKKQAYRTKIKEAINLKDMYQIQSTKLGPVNPRKFFDFSKFKYPNVSVKVFDRATFTSDEKLDRQSLTPISPKLGPYVIENPKIENKTYHWCSCGLSKKQPFCDSSHSSTGFRPINFKLAEKCESMMLCGCKLSKVAPFCDGATCIQMKKIEEEGIKKQIEIIDTLPNTEKLSDNRKKRMSAKTINTTSVNEEIKEKAI